MKKILAMVLAVLLLLSFAACGEKEEKTKLGGTWHIEYIEYEGSKFSVKEWENMDEDDLSDFYIIFKDGGKAYVYDDGYGDLVNWLQSDDAVMIGDEKASFVDEMICLDYYGDKIYLKKTSENQEIPQAEEEDEELTGDENFDDDISTTTTIKITTQATTKATTAAPKNVLSADFKTAMDSYEKFMNEYVTFMKKYKANSSDLSLLSDYANYMSKYAKFVEDFEKWEDEDLNTAELGYYVEVQARVSKKLLEIAS